MANFSFDTIKRVATIPLNGTSSGAISIPRNAGTLTILAPAALTTSTAWKLQSLSPQDHETNPAWNDLSTFDPSIAAPAVPVNLSITFGANQCVTFREGVYGGGTIRITVADAQAVARDFVCQFALFQN